MDALEVCDRLQLDNHLTFYQQINAIATVDPHAFVLHWQWLLPLDVKLSLNQLMLQTRFVR
jgi:hypothetical protein